MNTDDLSNLIHRTATTATSTSLSPLRVGALVDTDAWTQAFSEERQRLRAIAVAELAPGEIVFARQTAAAFHGIVVFAPDGVVHTIPRGQHPPKSHRDVIRHDVALPESDIDVVDGLLITTLDRTVFDLIRTARPEDGLAAFDSAIRKVAWDPDARSLDGAAAAAFVELVALRIRAASGARGIRQAREIIELTDGECASAGESRSRWRMYELRMPRPVLQLPIMTDLGMAYLDFAWPRLRRFGEFDGDVKFLDPEMTLGRTPEEVVLDQQLRRSAIERATGWSGMHWGWSGTADARTFWDAVIAQGWRATWRA